MQTQAIESDPLAAFIFYPFDQDEGFQLGIASVLSSPGDADVDSLTLRAKVFYFNRMTGASITVEQVQGEISNHDIAPQNTLTFAQLKALIETGKLEDVPNNKTISGELNAKSESVSSAPVRKKPWESQDSDSNTL